MPKKLSPENVALLYRNLASAARHELPFTDLFAVLKDDPELFSGKSPVASLMHEALKEGNSLPDAMARVPQQFPAATVELVRSAEKNGQLPETLDLLADEQAWLAQTGRMAVVYGYWADGIGAIDQKMLMNSRLASMPTG